MALYHFSKYTYTRGPLMRSAATFAQYILREGEKFAARRDLRATEVQYLPTWAQGNIRTYFAEAEQRERANGRVADSWELSLPRELTLAQQRDLVSDFVAMQQRGIQTTVWAIHSPIARDGGQQPHTHMLVSPRLQDGIERGREQFFAHWNGADPARGGCKKDLGQGRHTAYSVQRTAWSDLVNLHLERAGYDITVDPRSLRDRDIDRAGERDPQTEAERTRAYWHCRKEVLGLTPDLPHALAVERIARSMRYGDGPRLTLEQLRQQQREVEAHAAQLERHGYLVHAAIMAEQHRERTGAARTPATERQWTQLIHAGAQLGVSILDDAPQQGVRWPGRQKERDTGYEY